MNQATKIRLNSDFTDWYDYQFASKYENAALELTRIANNSDFLLSKRQQFQLLEEVGLNTPINGEVLDVAPKVNDNKLVVYLDEFAHRGEGKILVDAQQAQAQYPRHYCSAWIDTYTSSGLYSFSWRLLQIGNRGWWIRYQSLDSWLSNVGDNASIYLQDESTGFWQENERNNSILNNYPLFAIDFVSCKSQLLAISFNSAPDTKQAGLEEVVSAKEVYDLIANHIFNYMKGNQSRGIVNAD